MEVIKMKKNRVFVLAALALVSVFAFTACVQGATDINEPANPTAEPTVKMATEEPTAEVASEDMTASESEEKVDTALTFEGDAYNFDLLTTGGHQYKLSDLAGKKVYIKFWASWCSICLAGLSEVDELYAQYADSEDVVILTIVSPGASGEVASDKFKIWFRTEGYNFKVLMDQDGPVQSAYGIRGFPTSVFIDTSGNVYDTKIGHVDNATIDSILSDMS